jgi:hypothetical protein
MPSHKNQHFVPKCALKPFTLNGEGRAINVFNIPTNRAINNAPTKGQCARDYLYGKNLEAEKLLQEIEGEYAEIIRRLDVAKPLTELEIVKLKAFIIIQMRRTDLAIKQIRDFGNSVADKAFAGRPEQRPEDTRTDTEVMHESMRHAATLLHYIDDLKTVVFRNRTRVDFIMSDNPAIHTNRFHLQQLGKDAFGIANSGLILSMPVSPRLSVFCFDPQVYSLPNASGTQFVEITTEADAYALNEVQYLHANKNLYFQKWEDFNRISSEVVLLLERRSLAAKAIVYIRDERAIRPSAIIRDPETGEFRRYRKGTPEEESTATQKLIGGSIPAPRPFVWPSKLKLRAKPTTYFNGTAIGHVRKPEWLVKLPSRRERRRDINLIQVDRP